MNNRSVSILKQRAEDCLRMGLYQQGLRISEQCLELSPNDSALHLNKALFSYRLGDVTRSLAEINQAMSLDPLNYHAYFNLFSIQMESGQFEAAYKNLCCCLSVGYLLAGKSTNDPACVDKAIEFSFNNKEARALRCLQKLKEGKKIEALNQINYALYLDPSHPQLLAIQKRVYQDIGMKELKTLAKGPQRPRFEKLETCKEIPAADIIQTEIRSLLQEFNSLLARIAEPHVYLLPSWSVPKIDKSNQTIPERKINIVDAEIQPIKLNNIKKLVPKAVENLEEATPQVYFAATCKERESTIIGQSQKHESSIRQEKNSFLQQCRESRPAFESSFQRMSDISISNISQNSRLKVRSAAKVLDISQCLKSLISKEEDGDKLFCDESVQESGIEGSPVELKLAIDSLKLRPDEKVVLALQRVRTNQRGEKEEIKEIYEIVSRGEKLQLVKSLVPI